MGIKVNITRPIYIRKGPGRGFKEIGVIYPNGQGIDMDGFELGESWKGLNNWYFRINEDGQKQYYWEGGLTTESASDLHWSIRLLGIDKLWQFSKGENISVAILDTGIDMLNPNLKFYKGYNVLDGTANVPDKYFHGTYCASILKANGHMGVYGVAPNVNLIVIKIQQEDAGNTSNRAKGIQKAIELGAEVISMSFGDKESDSQVSSAIDQAISKGIICVAAAGNNIITSVEYPANIKGMIAVGNVACDNPLADPITFRISRDSTKSSGKANEEGITIVAPGDGLDAYDEKGKFAPNISGTSFATPFVAGLAAIWLSLAKQKGLQGDNPHKTFRSQLISTANTEMPGYNKTLWGAGLINPEEILKTIQT